MIGKRLGFAAVLLAGASMSASAEFVAANADGETDWTVEVAPPPPPGGGSPVTTPTTAEGGFSHSERIVFGEQMRNHVLDQICRNGQIPLGHSFSLTNYGAVGVNGTRRLRVLPDNHIAIEDSQRLSVDLGRTLLSREVGAENFGLWVGGHFDGTSVVVRPMPTTNSCDEIWRLLKVTDAKAIYPFKAERLEQMGVGELWKLPAVLTIGHSEAVSRVLTEASGATVTPVLSFGIGQAGSAMMTVYRMSENQIRFRFRISHARIHNKAGAVTAVYPAVAVFTTPANILMKFIDSELTRQLSHYLTNNMGLYFTTSDGQQLLMEFILDPKNPEDMEELASVLRGDFVTLLKMAQRMVNLQASAGTAQRDFRDLKAQQESALKRAANFPGLDISHMDSRTLHLMLPFLFDHARVSSQGDDRIVRLDAQGGEFRIFRADRNKTSGFVDLPIVGQFVKHNSQNSAQSFVFKDKDGKTTEPQAVYIRQEGFLRDGSGDVRRMAQDVDDITGMIGARGGAPDARLALPVDRLLPPEPAVEVPAARNFQTAPEDPTYHQGGLALTLVLNERAVAAIANAAEDLIVRAYANTVVDRADKAVLTWLVDNGMLKPGGTMEIDAAAIKERFHYDDQGIAWVRNLCGIAAKIVADVAAVRRSPTPEERARAMVKLMSGGGKSGLAYEDIMKVLVQLVDPLDVTADLVINVNKGIKGDPDLHTHMAIKKLRPDNPGLKAAGDAKNRFAQPSELVD